MHQNNIFFIFYKLFLTSAHQKHLKTLKKNNKPKKIKILGNAVPNDPEIEVPRSNNSFITAMVVKSLVRDHALQYVNFVICHMQDI
jgi:fructose-specific component phosphotransferase system IIB-like protein